MNRIELPCYPDGPGVYILSDETNSILYIGHSLNLGRRASSLSNIKTSISHIKSGFVHAHRLKGHTVYIQFIETSDYKAVEKKLISQHTPPWNIKLNTINKNKRETSLLLAASELRR